MCFLGLGAKVWYAGELTDRSRGKNTSSASLGSCEPVSSTTVVPFVPKCVRGWLIIPLIVWSAAKVKNRIYGECKSK